MTLQSNFQTSLIIPAHNEEDTIKIVLDRIVELRFPDKYEIIIIDDGSTDTTTSIINKYPVKLIKHQTNKGYGAALKTGIRKANGKYIITFDSDGQHDPADALKIESLLEDNELVIGERTKDSFQVNKRKLGKKLIRWIGEFLVDQKLPDYNSGFRGFHTELIKGLLHIMPNGFSFSTTSTLAFIKEGYSFATFPIKVTERQGRRSSVKLFSDGAKTFLLLFRIIMLFNPLKVFFPASIIITCFGVVFGIYGYLSFGRFANTAVIISLVGIFLFFTGLLADQIAIMNRKVN
jgi:glycosyltransferase involved in cell wall biosynthesis